MPTPVNSLWVARERARGNVESFAVGHIYAVIAWGQEEADKQVIFLSSKIRQKLLASLTLPAVEENAAGNGTVSIVCRARLGKGCRRRGENHERSDRDHDTIPSRNFRKGHK